MFEILCTEHGSIANYGALSRGRLLLDLRCGRPRTGLGVETERGGIDSANAMSAQKNMLRRLGRFSCSA